MAGLVRPLGVIAAALVLPAAAAAHVEPSVDRNNRYYKVTPMGDRVRVAVTVLFGEQPGAVLRRRLDRDRDGAIAPAEADVVGRELAAQLSASIALAVDGAPVTWRWDRVDVGLGTPTTAGGSFAVDLVTFVCTPGAGEHRLTLRDAHVLDAAGDSEVKLEDGPGIMLGTATLGGQRLDGVDAEWSGRGGPITIGLEVPYRAGDDAPRPRDGRCADARPASDDKPTRWPWFAAIGAAIGLGVAWHRARGHASRREDPSGA